MFLLSFLLCVASMSIARVVGVLMGLPPVASNVACQRSNILNNMLICNDRRQDSSLLENKNTRIICHALWFNSANLPRNNVSIRANEKKKCLTLTTPIRDSKGHDFNVCIKVHIYLTYVHLHGDSETDTSESISKLKLANSDACSCAFLAKFNMRIPDPTVLAHLPNRTTYTH